ncbi:VIT domain-containing protein [Lysobacter firmicutimachus]|uniref:VIT domain-containing protein n=1 Tax=Lysobacter firmicutimachus TaxID=1792846 RepID=A0ABU8D364_9GAMM
MKLPFAPAVLVGLLLSLPLGLAGLAGAQTPGHLTAPPLPPLLRVAGAETPIELESARVDGEIVGGLARTSIELVFRNPNARVLEGELQFPLQPDQQVAGFALDIGGAMRDAVPVPKAQGRQVFEAIERRGIDPGLLEQTAGNQFKLRVYPIPAGGTRRVRLDLVESLRRDGEAWQYQLPLRFADGAGRFEGELRTAQKPEPLGLARALKAERHGRGYRLALSARPPGEVLSLRLPRAERAESYVQDFAGERYFLAEVPLSGASAPRRLPQTVGLLWDSSASRRKRDHPGELNLLDRYFRAAGTVQVRLIRLRDRTEPAQTFQVRGGDWSALRRELDDTVYDGATDPGGWNAEAEIGEYLLVSDGLFNYGDQRLPELGPQQRLYALNSAGANGDNDRLRALAQAHGGRLVAWSRAGELERAARELLEQAPQLLSASGAGIADAAAELAFADGGLLRIAGRLRDAPATLRLRVRDADGERELSLPIAADAPASAFPATLWAQYSIRALQADPERHRAEIARLGRSHGLVTAETSLIVLEEAADYARYRIEPPAPLREEYRRLLSAQEEAVAGERRIHLDLVAGSYQQRIDWWQRDFPKGKPPAALGGNERYRLAEAAPAAAAGIAPMPALPAPSDSAREPTTLDSVEMPAEAAAADAGMDRIVVTASRIAHDDQAGPSGPVQRPARIALQAWEPDSPYARRLRKADAGSAYAIYLDERDSYAGSTAFYLDVADVLFEKGRPELALRVLSNLAELDLENRHVLRVLGYRLMQAGQPALAAQVLERVLAMAEEEPQSFRDLGLAYAAAGRPQEAVDRLYEVALRAWDGRFDGIEEIALAELNAIAAAHPDRVDLSRVDPRLRRNLPLALRAVLSWDSDNSDMDLWVTDPNGEKCYYGNPLTYQGGRITDDFTGGYGPEEFALRRAKPGKYKVEAQFFGDRQQLVTGATTLNLRLSTGFGGPGQQDRQVTLRLKDAKEQILVGEFEVR